MELQKISQALDSYIRPGTFPVGIRMVSSMTEIPNKARLPKRDLGKPMPVCQGISLARRYGWTLAMGKEDMLCPLGAITLGFLPKKPKLLDGSFEIPFWAKKQDIRAKIMRRLPQLQVEKYSHVVIAPLFRTEFDPQVIIIYGNPAQISRLIQAAIYATGEPIVSSSDGAAACSKEITEPILTDQSQFIIVGGGDRTIAQVQDHEASFAIPYSKVETLVEGLEATHKVGIRYPTLSFLTYRAEFPPSFGELMDYLGQGG